MSAKVIDGRSIAEKVRKKVSERVDSLVSKHGVTPNIATVKIGSESSSDLYLRLRDNACKKVGIKSTHVEFPNDVSEKRVVDSIKDLNKDEGVHGVLIQFPIPDHISKDKLIDALSPDKDVEGLTAFNMGRTLLGDENIVPCTPLAVLTILEHENVSLKGKDVVIVNHSDVVGKPLAAMFLNRNATVSVCHVFTKDMKFYTSKADILVSATGKSGIIKSDFVKKDAILVDVGIVKTEDGVTGDVDFESVKNKAGSVTPVPGGVGPVTVASSLSNMVKTYKNTLK